MLLIMMMMMMKKITLKQPAWSLPGILQRWRLTGRGTSQSPVYDNCDGDDGGNNGAVDNKGDDRESTTVYGLQCRTCMLRWLNRLIPSSLIAIHSSEPSIVYNWQWCQLWGGNGKFGDDDDVVLPSVLAAASKRVAPKNCHLRVHVNRIRTCIFVQMLMMMTNTKVWRRTNQMFENSRSQWRSCPRVLATSRPNSSQGRSDPRFQPGLCKNKHQQIVNIKSYIKKRKIENGFL